MSAVEARFYVAGYERQSYDPNATTVTLRAVGRGEHNKNWAAATPMGEIKMVIKNAGAADWFVGKLGEEISVLFTPAPSDPSS